jgi:hypothetical protein
MNYEAVGNNVLVRRLWQKSECEIKFSDGAKTLTSTPFGLPVVPEE